jgi:hypothetical protein
VQLLVEVDDTVWSEAQKVRAKIEQTRALAEGEEDDENWRAILIKLEAKLTEQMAEVGRRMTVLPAPPSLENRPSDERAYRFDGSGKQYMGNYGKPSPCSEAGVDLKDDVQKLFENPEQPPASMEKAELQRRLQYVAYASKALYESNPEDKKTADWAHHTVKSIQFHHRSALGLLQGMKLGDVGNWKVLASAARKKVTWPT